MTEAAFPSLSCFQVPASTTCRYLFASLCFALLRPRLLLSPASHHPCLVLRPGDISATRAILIDLLFNLLTYIEHAIMNSYRPEVMGTQLVDIPYLTPQFGVDDMACRIPGPNTMVSSVEHESFDHFMGGHVDNMDFRPDRSLSFSVPSSQSMSPQPHDRHIDLHLPEIQTSNLLFDSSTEQISPTTSISTSRTQSMDEGHRAEVGSPFARYTGGQH